METSTRPISLFGGENLTYLQEASPANLFPGQGTEREPSITVTSGRQCSMASPRSGPLGSLQKMLLESSRWRTNPVFGKRYSLEWTVRTLPAYRRSTVMKRYTHDKKRCCSTVSHKTLKKLDMPSKFTVFQLQVSERSTKGKGFGLLPTPMAQSREVNLEQTLARKEKYGGKKRAMYLENYLAMGLIPTPRVSGQEGYETRRKRQGHKKAISYLEANVEYHVRNGMLPTPTVRDYKGGNSMEHLTRKELNDQGTVKKNHIDQLPNYIKLHTNSNTQLNPLFVAQMMGYPANWTVLPFLIGEGKASRATETP